MSTKTVKFLKILIFQQEKSLAFLENLSFSFIFRDFEFEKLVVGTLL